MSEHDIVNRTSQLVTVGGMTQDLQKLGVRSGDLLLVHSSLSSLGWVCGGAQAVLQALQAAVGSDGTLVMPAHSSDWSDPREWGHPPVPEFWFDIIYREMPAFDAALSPTRGMGRIAELFRTWPGSLRSAHPQASFCANGPHAARIVAEHPLSPQFGENSPLGKLYALKAKVLLLGVDFDSCTSFHMAETALDGMPVMQMGAAITEHGERTWKTFTDFAYDPDDFAELGEAFEAAASVRRGPVGEATCRLFDLKSAVDFARHWLGQHRQQA